MKKLILFQFFFCRLIYAQPNVDSLINCISKTKEDTSRIQVYLLLAENHPDENEWQKYNQAAIDLAQKLSESKDAKIKMRSELLLSSALNNKGFIELDNNFVTATELFNRALNLKRKYNTRKGTAEIYCNLGAAMEKMGKLQNAVEYYQLALKEEALNPNPSIKGAIINNLATLYVTLFNNEKAFEYFDAFIKLNKEQKNDEGLFRAYINLSVFYANLSNVDMALKYIYKGLEITNKTNNIKFENEVYAALCDAYASAKQFDSCVFYANKGIPISIQINDYKSLASNYYNMGLFCNSKRDFKKAELYMARSINIYDSIKDIYGVKNVVNLIASVYDSLGDYKNSSKNLKLLTKIKDSLFNEESRNALIKLGFQMEFDKKEAELKITQLKNEQEIEKQKLIKNGLIIGSVLLLGLIALIFVNLKNTKRSQRQLAIKNDKIEQQKRLVEEKQTEIISSINYAQRIQSAVLTGEAVWKKISKEHFILFKPKDIVSGDFYWAHVLANGRAVFALADCTGHGVPGAFMSMLGNSFLNEIVVENKIFNAATILNKLREKIINALEQEGNSEQKDGMDIALCVWNKMDNTLEFAGANNGLYLVRDNKIAEFTGNKMPIGTYTGHDEPFASQIINLQKNDCIYITTDGFPDQFGGENGKKFKYKQFEELLLSVNQLPMEEQSIILKQKFKDWIGSLEQIDDVSIIGVRV